MEVNKQMYILHEQSTLYIGAHFMLLGCRLNHKCKCYQIKQNLLNVSDTGVPIMHHGMNN